MTTDNRLVVTRPMTQVPIALCAVGVIAFAAGLFTATDRTWLNLLIDGWYLLALGERERQLERTQYGGDIEDIDADKLEDLLGPEAKETLDQLKQFLEILEE